MDFDIIDILKGKIEHKIGHKLKTPTDFNLLSLAIESAKAKARKLLGKEELLLLKFKEECSYQCDSKYQSYYQGVAEEFYNSKITVEAKVEIVAC